MTPETRPWFQLAASEFDSLRWTVPYTFFTTKDPGITVSRSFRTPSGDTMIIGYDVMLQDISRFTSNLQISPNGQVFIVTDDDRVLGLPHSENFQTQEQRRGNVLKKPEENKRTSSGLPLCVIIRYRMPGNRHSRLN